ncbi:hypothetical protein CVT25_003182 [Psilocybe cyanescens]|uniref:Chorismate mutase domain-containing protein n=1 Tax=Psilocybe cyanescens TaxID=93625 RepID=A0A409XF22_PSICY|nr:hypothetical protein CVT25_003182 [Psilocybe cyanescens]
MKAISSPSLVASFPILFLCLSSILSVTASVQRHAKFDFDFARECYKEPLPAVTPSADNRTVPWSTPGIVVNTNGTNTTCCSSLDEVRAGIDDVDTKLLALLSQRYAFLNLGYSTKWVVKLGPSHHDRAAYVREATRFKATRDVVDVPARDQQVIDDAVASASDPQINLPETIARAVFTAIINSSVPFERCVVSLHPILTMLVAACRAHCVLSSLLQFDLFDDSDSSASGH